MTRILLVTPPLTQLNTPYPATAYLTGFLSGRGYTVHQADLGIELVLRLFSREGLAEVFRLSANADPTTLSPNLARIMAFQEEYLATIDTVIRFLQNKDATLAHRICQDDYLPQASRFEAIDDLQYSFGTMGIQDRARHLATLYLEDLGDLIVGCITPDFGFSRYAERLARTATTFDALHDALQAPSHYLDELLLEQLAAHIERTQPDIVGFSVPFPGNLYGALKCGQYLKAHHPEIKILMGGGYPNTELRSLREPRVFDYVDYITLDDGEAPLLKLLAHLAGELPQSQLQRTYLRDARGQVQYIHDTTALDIPHTEIGTPDYCDLPLDSYLSIIEMTNPMHRLWSDGRWNKLTIAHGCYWKRCSFCDITLDYIHRYDKAPAELLVDRIEAIVAQTGETGFHFVDEAAPPASLRDLALELLRRKVQISWWANIRFEKTFTPDLCRLLAASGCIAVSGGLEVASDRLLALMEKGVSIAQVARVTRGFTDAGIMVHAYLMYGFPTQTEQETIDSLEVVRQLFVHNCIQSAFWHQFAMTVHSPVGKYPERYQVVRTGPDEGPFANNDLYHDDPTGADHERYTDGLKKALYNYMLGLGLDTRVREWFDFRVPAASHAPTLIQDALEEGWPTDGASLHHRLCWVGPLPRIDLYEADDEAELTIYSKRDTASLTLNYDLGEWLEEVLPAWSVRNAELTTLKSIAAHFEAAFGVEFEAILDSELWEMLRAHGLLLVRC